MFKVIKHLKRFWLDHISQIVKMSLGYLGKGWFNMNEKDPDIYNCAKVLRFLELIKHRMQVIYSYKFSFLYTLGITFQIALRDLMLTSAESFTTLVETPCLTCMGCEPDLEWGSDIFLSPFKPHVQAIFSLTLKMQDTGAYYNTDIHEYKVHLTIVLLCGYI